MNDTDQELFLVPEANNNFSWDLTGMDMAGWNGPIINNCTVDCGNYILFLKCQIYPSGCNSSSRLAGSWHHLFFLVVPTNHYASFLKLLSVMSSHTIQRCNTNGHDPNPIHHSPKQNTRKTGKKGSAVFIRTVFSVSE